MKVDSMDTQKIKLFKAYQTSYNNLFEKHFKKINNDEDMTLESIKADNDAFHKEYSNIRNLYEAYDYNLDMKAKPSIYTMTSAVNQNQKLLIENMNKRLDEEYDILQQKLSSEKYNWFEKLNLEQQYEDLKQEIREHTNQQIAEFRDIYFDALQKRNYNKIDKIEDDLLAKLLNRIED